VRLTLDIPHADVTAGALRCSLSQPVRPAVAALDVADGTLRVRLRVLAASHQVEVEMAGRLLVRETVACDVTGGERLADRVTPLGTGRHEIVTTMRSLDDPVYLDAVADAMSPDDHRSLLARFGVVADAVTLLRVADAAGDDTARWESFHAYPQEGTVVHTRSRMIAA